MVGVHKILCPMYLLTTSILRSLLFQILVLLISSCTKYIEIGPRPLVLFDWTKVNIFAIADHIQSYLHKNPSSKEVDSVLLGGVAAVAPLEIFNLGYVEKVIFDLKKNVNNMSGLVKASLLTFLGLLSLAALVSSSCTPTPCGVNTNCQV